MSDATATATPDLAAASAALDAAQAVVDGAVAVLVRDGIDARQVLAYEVAHAAAAIAAGGTPVFAFKGETLEQYWDYTHRIFDWADGGAPNMILDDGGDATLLLHLGSNAETDASVLSKPGSEEETILFAAIRKRLEKQPGWYSKTLKNIQGVT